MIQLLHYCNCLFVNIGGFSTQYSRHPLPDSNNNILLLKWCTCVKPSLRLFIQFQFQKSKENSVLKLHFCYCLIISSQEKRQQWNTCLLNQARATLVILMKKNLCPLKNRQRRRWMSRYLQSQIPHSRQPWQPHLHPGPHHGRRHRPSLAAEHQRHHPTLNWQEAG